LPLDTTEPPRFSAGGSLASQVGLDHPDVLCLFAFAAGSDIELDALTLIKRLVTISGDVRIVNEDVIALFAGNEPETLFGVEKLHCALCHELPISQHG
jgi:hypothetical protein